MREEYVRLPDFRQRVRTDIYTFNSPSQELRKTGVRFSSSHLVGEAYASRYALNEDYAFGFYGRWKFLGLMLYRASRFPFYGEGVLFRLSLLSASLTAGWAEGGPVAGFRLGERLYLKGLYTTAGDTFRGIGIGYTGKSYDLFLTLGDGLLAEVFALVGGWEMRAGYTSTRRLNVFRFEAVKDWLGVAANYGSWVGYSGVELQSFLRVEGKLLRVRSGFSVREDGNYAYDFEVVPLPLLLFNAILLKPTLRLYGLKDSLYLASAGVESVFYEDLSIAVFYDYGILNGVRLSVNWTLWD